MNASPPLPADTARAAPVCSAAFPRQAGNWRCSQCPGSRPETGPGARPAPEARVFSETACDGNAETHDAPPLLRKTPRPGKGAGVSDFVNEDERCSVHRQKCRAASAGKYFVPASGTAMDHCSAWPLCSDLGAGSFTLRHCPMSNTRPAWGRRTRPRRPVPPRCAATGYTWPYARNGRASRF